MFDTETKELEYSGIKITIEELSQSMQHELSYGLQMADPTKGGIISLENAEPVTPKNSAVYLKAATKAMMASIKQVSYKGEVETNINVKFVEKLMSRLGPDKMVYLLTEMILLGTLTEDEVKNL